MAKLGIRYLIVSGMSIAFIVNAATGLIKFPGLLEIFGIRRISLPLGYISTIHDWSGAALIAFIIAHIVLNFKWIACTTKTVFKRNDKTCEE